MWSQCLGVVVRWVRRNGVHGKDVVAVVARDRLPNLGYCGDFYEGGVVLYEGCSIMVSTVRV